MNARRRGSCASVHCPDHCQHTVDAKILLLHYKRKYLEFTDVVDFKDLEIREITNF